MNDLGEDLSALRTTVKHVDERTLRGEGVMMSMQVEQHRMSRVLDLVAEKLEVKAIAQTPKTLDLVPEEEMEDDPEFDEKP